MFRVCFWILVSLSTAWCEEEFYQNVFDDKNLSAAHTYERNVEEQCRVSDGFFFERSHFALFTCASCYRHMPDDIFLQGKRFIHVMKKGFSYLKDYSTGELYIPDISNKSSPVWNTFATPKGGRVWEECCKAAVSCCEVMLQTPKRGGVYCPRTWDGWNCWSDTDNGTTVEDACPSHVYFHTDPPQCTRFATKRCESNGTWFHHNITEWSNYTTCRQEDHLKLLLNVHITTFAISIVSLVPALIIFFVYKQLRVFRISMHKNLFMSLLLNGVFVIIFQSYFMADHFRDGDSVLEGNRAGCKLFYTATKYFRLCSYMWMFCEGFYLRKLIAAAFTEQKNMIIFYIMGWGFPLVPVTVWAIVRVLKANDRCWTVPYGDFEWVLNCTMLIALLANLFFLGDIVRVLVTKLRSTNSDEPTQFRRAVKVTTVLIPLFGLHLILLIYHPRKAPCWWMTFYTNATYAVDGIQGAVVSLIFCYLNNEVLYLLKRSYKRRKLIMNVGSHTNSRRITTSRASMSTNVDSFVLPDAGHDKSCRSK